MQRSSNSTPCPNRRLHPESTAPELGCCHPLLQCMSLVSPGYLHSRHCRPSHHAHITDHFCLGIVLIKYQFMSRLISGEPESGVISPTALNLHSLCNNICCKLPRSSF
jgi:hypothetical protein